MFIYELALCWPRWQAGKLSGSQEMTPGLIKISETHKEGGRTSIQWTRVFCSPSPKYLSSNPGENYVKVKQFQETEVQKVTKEG